MKASFTKKEIFIQAHKMAKTFVGNYQACFSLALKEIYNASKVVLNPVTELNTKFNVNVKLWNSSIQDIIDSFDSDYLEASIEASSEIRLKKSFIFVPFKNSKKQECIKCVGNSFDIKEDLKALGFEYNKAPMSGWNLIIS